MRENEKEQIRKVICMALSALLELSEKEYDAFASVHPYANFLNSIYSGRKFALRGWDVHYVGICHDGEMAVATLLGSVKLHGSYRYFYFRSVLRIRDREGFEENVLFHKLCIHLPSGCDPDPGADGIHPQHVHRILRCDAF